MRINIELDSENKGDLVAFLNLLTGFGTERTIVKTDQRTVVLAAEQTAAAPVAESVVEQPAPEQPRRTRRTKAEIEAAKAAADPEMTREYNRDELLAAAKQVANTPANTPAPQTASQLPPATEQSSASISIDDLRAALQGFTSAKGMPAGIELLKKFGCSRISELAAKDEATKQGFLKEATV